MIWRHDLKAVLIFLPLLAALVLWEAAASHSSQFMFLFSSPLSVMGRLGKELLHSAIWINTAITSFEALGGLLIGTVAGTAGAFLLWYSPQTNRVFQPALVFLGAIPLISLAPVLVLWFGIDLWSKIVVASYGVFLIAISQTLEGLKSTAQDDLDFAREINAKALPTIRFILLPSAARWILAGIRLNLGAAFFGAFVGEFISSKSGLGHFILECSQTYDMTGVMAGILVFGSLSLMLERLIRMCIPRQFSNFTL